MHGSWLTTRLSCTHLFTVSAVDRFCLNSPHYIIGEDVTLFLCLALPLNMLCTYVGCRTIAERPVLDCIECCQCSHLDLFKLYLLENTEAGSWHGSGLTGAVQQIQVYGKWWVTAGILCSLVVESWHFSSFYVYVHGRGIQLNLRICATGPCWMIIYFSIFCSHWLFTISKA
jgi:hypothetical protein